MNAWAVIGLVWIGAALALGLIVGKVIARGESTDWDALAKLMKSAAIRERADIRSGRGRRRSYDGPAGMGWQEREGTGVSSEGVVAPVPFRGEKRD